MLPTTTATTMEVATNEDNAVNLNAAFVTENSLEAQVDDDDVISSESGNFEAETNKPDNDSDDNSNRNNSDMEQFDATTNIASVEAQAEQAVNSLIANEGLTIESNEEAEANDNLNESSTKEAARAEGGDHEELTEELEALVLSESASAEDVENQRLTATDKPRENVYSDDESDAEETEMTAGFNSEWADIAEELAAANDRDNDLSNEIDAYDAVPVDLSNDIAVNEWAAAQPSYVPNPDAEFVDVVDGVTMPSVVPKFEKLSVAAARNPTSYQPTPYAQNMK